MIALWASLQRSIPSSNGVSIWDLEKWLPSSGIANNLIERIVKERSREVDLRKKMSFFVLHKRQKKLGLLLFFADTNEANVFALIPTKQMVFVLFNINAAIELIQWFSINRERDCLWSTSTSKIEPYPYQIFFGYLYSWVISACVP